MITKAFPSANSLQLYLYIKTGVAAECCGGLQFDVEAWERLPTNGAQPASLTALILIFVEIIQHLALDV
jgi:hypothetical protein